MCHFYSIYTNIHAGRSLADLHHVCDQQDQCNSCEDLALEPHYSEDSTCAVTQNTPTLEFVATSFLVTLKEKCKVNEHG